VCYQLLSYKYHSASPLDREKEIATIAFTSSTGEKMKKVQLKKLTA
jgi:hypothetical protein